MSERLTERDCNGVVGFKGLMRYYNFNDFQKMAKKLLYYEDLEEQGRLLVLPEGLDKETFLEHLAVTACPAFVGLKDWGGTKKCNDTTCKKCWEAALKGE